MDDPRPTAVRRWTYALSGPRSFAVRHVLIVFVPLGAISLLAGLEGGVDPWRWVGLVALATATGVLVYVVGGRFVRAIRSAERRGVATLAVYGLTGLARGALLVVAAEDALGLDEARAVSRLLWNLLAGLVLLSAVAIADRELADVVPLQAAVDRSRRARERLERLASTEELVRRWSAALRAEAGRHFDEPGSSPAGGSGRRLLDDLHARLTAEATRAAEALAPRGAMLPSPGDRRELLRLATDALERAIAPVAAVMALCVAVLHELRDAGPIGVAVLLSGVVVAAAISVVLMVLLVAVVGRLLGGAAVVVRAAAISVGLLLIGAAAAWGDLEVDRLVLGHVGDVTSGVVVPRLMLAALVAGWAWMVILGLGPYADALREEDRRESRLIVQSASRQLASIEEAEALLRDRLRTVTEPVVHRLEDGATDGDGRSAAVRSAVLASIGGRDRG